MILSGVKKLLETPKVAKFINSKLIILDLPSLNKISSSFTSPFSHAFALAFYI